MVCASLTNNRRMQTHLLEEDVAAAPVGQQRAPGPALRVVARLEAGRGQVAAAIVGLVGLRLRRLVAGAAALVEAAAAVALVF